MSYFANWQSPERRAQATIWQAAQTASRPGTSASRPRSRQQNVPPASSSPALPDEAHPLFQEMLWLALQARSSSARLHFYQVYHIVDLFRRASPCRSHWFGALRSFRFKHKLELLFPDLLVTLAEFQGAAAVDIAHLRRTRDDLLAYVSGLKADSNLKAQLRAAYAVMNLSK